MAGGLWAIIKSLPIYCSQNDLSLYKLIPMDVDIWECLLLVALGIWLIWWSFITAKKGFYIGTNEYGANMGKICKETPDVLARNHNSRGPRIRVGFLGPQSNFLRD